MTDFTPFVRALVARQPSEVPPAPMTDRQRDVHHQVRFRRLQANLERHGTSLPLRDVAVLAALPDVDAVLISIDEIAARGGDLAFRTIESAAKFEMQRRTNGGRR